MKRLFKILVGVILVLVVIGAIGYPIYRHVTHVNLDLSPLAPYHKTQNYATLIKDVKSKPIGPDGFTFIALGDTRSNIDVARRVLKAAAAEKPAFIISNGDIVRRGRVEEYLAHHLRLVKMIAPIPFIPVPGNHEAGPNDDFATFKAVYGGEQFSFDYGNCRFVGVNDSTRWGMTGADLAYLKQELSKPGVKYKFVLFHVPPRFLKDAVQTAEGRGFRWHAGAFRQLMKDEHVTEVFMGHIHGFATEVLDGVRYTITGGGGANLAKELGPEGAVHNYVVVHVTPGGLKQEEVKYVGEKWIRVPIQ